MKVGARFLKRRGLKVYNKLNVACYLVCKWLIERNPSLALNPWIKKILEECFQDWVKWKTAETMDSVARQVEAIKEQWQKEDNERIVEKVKEMFPNAKVSTHDEKTGAVLIEHPPNGSLAQSLLGGTIEIRSPWLLDSNKEEES